MNMNNCPECGHQREGDEYKCPKCDCFYSQLDEILATEEEEKESRSLKGRLKSIQKSDDSINAFKQEFNKLKDATTEKALLTLALIFMFVFALVLSVM